MGEEVGLDNSSLGEGIDLESFTKAGDFIEQGSCLWSSVSRERPEPQKQTG